MKTRPRVVIVGREFGGLAVAGRDVRSASAHCAKIRLVEALVPQFLVSADRAQKKLGVAVITDTRGTDIAAGSVRLAEREITAQTVIRAETRSRAMPAPFGYRHWGSLAMIARNKTVADFNGLRLRGVPARVIWSIVHGMQLDGGLSRRTVAQSRIWSHLTEERGARLILPAVTASPGRELMA